MKGTEIYYAIRRGDPRRHITYFMLRDGEQTPRLFSTREAAERAATGIELAKVQRVKLEAIR